MTLRLKELHFSQVKGSLHPKLFAVRDEVVRQLKERPRGKLWIRLHRLVDKVVANIHKLLKEADIGCSVDPKSFPSEQLKWVSWSVPENVPVVVTDRLPKDFPTSALSLIIEYERLSSKLASNEDSLEAIPKKSMTVLRPDYVQVVERELACSSSKTVDSGISPQNSSDPTSAAEKITEIENESSLPVDSSDPDPAKSSPYPSDRIDSNFTKDVADGNGVVEDLAPEKSPSLETIPVRNPAELNPPPISEPLIDSGIDNSLAVDSVFSDDSIRPVADDDQPMGEVLSRENSDDESVSAEEGDHSPQSNREK